MYTFVWSYAKWSNSQCTNNFIHCLIVFKDWAQFCTANESDQLLADLTFRNSADSFGIHYAVANAHVGLE